ncbi:hypothetical protein CS063_09065 [Sporanaerobium hydrogeniformans]|uniref:Uncharacterized protein n=1 Tax=Sporanaerobium hydrogeniformans TaxID=3072179 RepID=A0AC61DDI7_9FIRM|nr:hypothetical protein [Sporanaerobium hydrogeniformans]PHV70672.1 hypothetical protein CS063_09065 [Sporanaerobium hydrogeniformans]
MFKWQSLYPLLLLVLGIITYFITLRYKIRTSSRSKEEILEEFFEKELEASQVVRGTLPQELFIPINTEAIPASPDVELESLYQKVLTIGKLPMVNLKEKSNRDLKKLYGINHLDTLITYEKNYDTFIDILIKYGTILNEKNYTEAAQLTLEYALDYGCDRSRPYFILAELYSKQKNTTRLTRLKVLAQTKLLTSPYLSKVLHHIDELQETCK